MGFSCFCAQAKEMEDYNASLMRRAESVEEKHKAMMAEVGIAQTNSGKGVQCVGAWLSQSSRDLLHALRSVMRYEADLTL